MCIVDEYHTSVQGLSAIFYINDNAELKMSEFTVDLTNLYTTGVQVLIQGGTIPDLTLSLVSGPGIETTIRQQLTQVTHLPSPYSDCMTPKTYNLLDGRITSNDTNVQYSYDDVCLRQDVIDQCGCGADAFLYTTEQLKMTNYTVC